MRRETSGTYVSGRSSAASTEKVLKYGESDEPYVRKACQVTHLLNPSVTIDGLRQTLKRVGWAALGAVNEHVQRHRCGKQWAVLALRGGGQWSKWMQMVR